MINRSLKFLIYILLSSNCILGKSGLMIMSPEPASEVSGEDVLIAVSLMGVTGLDINSFTLLLDGADVTDQAYIDSDMVSYLIDRINPGDHEVSLLIKGAVEPLVWGFKIFSKFFIVI